LKIAASLIGDLLQVKKIIQKLRQTSKT
jgi:hypothetical protein